MRRQAGFQLCVRVTHNWYIFSILSIKSKERFMAKGQDSKKAVKKKPEKTLKEKRAEKKEKKVNNR